MLCSVITKNSNWEILTKNLVTFADLRGGVFLRLGVNTPMYNTLLFQNWNVNWVVQNSTANQLRNLWMRLILQLKLLKVNYCLLPYAFFEHILILYFRSLQLL